MKLFNWIITKLYQVDNFFYFQSNINSDKVRQMERWIEFTTEDLEKSFNSGTAWYQWIDKANNKWYEVKVERDKYHLKDKVCVWQYNALDKLLAELANE